MISTRVDDEAKAEIEKTLSFGHHDMITNYDLSNPSITGVFDSPFSREEYDLPGLSPLCASYKR